jgi:hypothetical protein
LRLPAQGAGNALTAIRKGVIARNERVIAGPAGLTACLRAILGMAEGLSRNLHALRNARRGADALAARCGYTAAQISSS